MTKACFEFCVHCIISSQQWAWSMVPCWGWIWGWVFNQGLQCFSWLDGWREVDDEVERGVKSKPKWLVLAKESGYGCHVFSIRGLQKKHVLSKYSYSPNSRLEMLKKSGQRLVLKVTFVWVWAPKIWTLFWPLPILMVRWVVETGEGGGVVTRECVISGRKLAGIVFWLTPSALEGGKKNARKQLWERTWKAFIYF